MLTIVKLDRLDNWLQVFLKMFKTVLGRSVSTTYDNVKPKNELMQTKILLTEVFGKDCNVDEHIYVTNIIIVEDTYLLDFLKCLSKTPLMAETVKRGYTVTYVTQTVSDWRSTIEKISKTECFSKSAVNDLCKSISEAVSKTTTHESIIDVSDD